MGVSSQFYGSELCLKQNATLFCDNLSGYYGKGPKGTERLSSLSSQPTLPAQADQVGNGNGK